MDTSLHKLKWGVFEYSHEFGMISFSEKTRTDILNSFLSYIIENYKPINS